MLIEDAACASSALHLGQMATLGFGQPLQGQHSELSGLALIASKVPPDQA
ncbi:hypothetical protein DSM14862_03817 (plasmid) [Sulfitobacter indolifex]|nr:hypothetical protein DSM14862_03297 [Sulfitobacter indolifex]UOA20978.1 hypothetical protein DSM14862_03817 [Sulfitobacter indolifex]